MSLTVLEVLLNGGMQMRKAGVPRGTPAESAVAVGGGNGALDRLLTERSEECGAELRRMIKGM